MSTRNLYAYDLPAVVLDSITLRQGAGIPPQDPAPAVSSVVAASSATGNGACPHCPGSSAFASSAAQRAHLRSDWHRYNLAISRRRGKGAAQGQGHVDEKDFDVLCDDLETPPSSSSESDAEPTRLSTKPARLPSDVVSQLLRKYEQEHPTEATEGSASDDDLQDERSARAAATAQSPLFWFVSRPDIPQEARQLLEQTQLGVHRSLYPDREEDPNAADPQWHVAALRRMQVVRLAPPGGRSANAARALGKRLKGAGIQEAAATLGLAVLDGHDHVARMGIRFEDDIEGDSDVGSSSDDDEYYDDGQSSAPSTTLSADTALSQATPPIRTWTLIMLASGHFAAVVVGLNVQATPPSRRTGTSERGLLVLAHKTFHRYTTRRKQGGAQSAQDASGKFAKSAGAQLRRAGEAALADEVRGLLDLRSWRELIGRSERVWVRAGARAARGLLWNWDEQGRSSRIKGAASPLDEPRADGRLRALPIPTRRPGLGELVRCFAELTRVKVTHRTEEELAQEDEEQRRILQGGREREAMRTKKAAQAAAAAKAKEDTAAAKAGKVPTLSEAERLRRDRFLRLVDATRRGRVDAIVDLLAKYEVDLLRPGGWDAEPLDDGDSTGDTAARSRIDAPLPEWWRADEARGLAPTALVPSSMLQVAAEGGHDEAVRFFALQRNADPTLPVARPPLPNNDADGTGPLAAWPHRTAYDVCSTRGARNALRRLMAEQPQRCDWANMGPGGARVPSELTAEREEAQVGKVKDRRAALRDKARERERERAAAEAAAAADAPLLAKETPVQAPAPSGPTNRLGGPAPANSNAALRALREQDAGLSPELKARIERERRARAAEARMRGLGG